MDSSKKRISNLHKKAKHIFEKEGIMLSVNVKKILDEILEELSIHQIKLEQQNSELKNLNEKTKLQKKEFESLYQNAPNAYFEINNHLEIIKCNKSAHDLLYSDNNEIIGRKFNTFIHPEKQDQFHKAILKAKKNIKSTYTAILKHTQKTDKHVILSIEPDQFNTDCIRISGLDISDRMKENRNLIESESRFRVMVNNLSDAIYIHKISGEILDTNEQASKILGYTREEFLKMTPLDFSNQYLTRKEYLEVIDLIRKNKKYTFEDEHIAKNGKIVPVEVASSITKYQDEEVIFSVAHNMTSRKEAEKEQNKLIEQLNYLSNSATKFITFKSFGEIYRYLGKSLNNVLDGSMIVVGEFHNDCFTIIDYFGVDQKLLNDFKQITNNQKVKNTYKPDIDQLNLYRSGNLEKTGDINNMFMNYFDEKTQQRINDTIKPTDVRIIGVTHNKKLFAGINIVLSKKPDVIDIKFTQALVYQASIAIQRKTYENELIQTKNQEEILNTAKTTFLTNIGHEIRTPLNTIMGFTEILSNLNDDPLKESYIKSISNSGKNLLLIINDILDLSKIESGSMQINQMVMSVKTLLDELDYTFRKIAENKGLTLDIHIDKNVPDMVQMDQPRLRQILHNLVSNAIKFTNEGKVSIRTIVKKKKDSTQLIFNVEDTGIGIDEKKISGILMPFAQADSTDARKYEGTGMGLSIAKKLTEMLNGELQIKSKPEKGSIFTVILNDIHSKVSNPKNEKLFNPIKFNKEKILVIGDDMSQLEIIQSVIDKNNLLAFIAETGEQGFAFAFEFKPDFIMINLSENQNALDTAKNIKSIDDFHHVPVIAVLDTINNDSEFSIDDTLVDEIITPPVTEEKLLTILGKYFEGDNSINTHKNQEKEFNFVIKDLKTLTKLTNELETSITPLCKELEKRQPLKKVKELSTRLNDISKKYHSPIVKEYCKNIDNSIKSFDIVKMRELIHDYSRLIDALHAKINKQK